jgi:Ion channel
MQSEQPTEPNEPKPAPETPEEPKPAAEAVRGSKPNESPEINRVIWERTRLNRAIEAFLIQGFLWAQFFAFSRGIFTGVRFVIPLVISVAILTYVVISVTKFGNTFDIAIELFHGFSVLLVVFSTLYWSYGTSANFSEPLTRLDAIYFSVGTLSTAGTGNISAVS